MKTKIISLVLALAATSLCTKAVASDFSGSLDLTRVDVVASNSINNSPSAESSLPWTTLIAVAILINCPYSVMFIQNSFTEAEGRTFRFNSKFTQKNRKEFAPERTQFGLMLLDLIRVFKLLNGDRP